MKYHSFDPKTEQRRAEKERRRRERDDAAQKALNASRAALPSPRVVAPAPKTRTPRKRDSVIQDYRQLVRLISRAFKNEQKMLASDTGTYRLFKTLGMTKPQRARAATLASARLYGFFFVEVVTAKAMLMRLLRQVNDNEREEILREIAALLTAADVATRSHVREILKKSPESLRKEVHRDLLIIREELHLRPPRIKWRYRNMNNLGFSLEKKRHTG